MENEKRFYILVPKTVQVKTVVNTQHMVSSTIETYPVETITSFRMVPGRLLAQTFHIGRKIESWRRSLGIQYEDITAISLSVRNTRELQKVSKELMSFKLREPAFYDEFYDTNLDFYGTTDSVQTATVIGPVFKEELDSIIGHLELYE